ncbi:hypothetical protein [Streptomyces sp. enrichment culture]
MTALDRAWQLAAQRHRVQGTTAAWMRAYEAELAFLRREVAFPG